MAATQDMHGSGVSVSRVDALYIVDVKIIKGIDLMAGDKNGTSDPYVKVKCGNREFKTNKKDKTLNPEWNATTQMKFLKEPQDDDV